jgi:hypothetical protein
MDAVEFIGVYTLDVNSTLVPPAPDLIMDAETLTQDLQSNLPTYSQLPRLHCIGVFWQWEGVLGNRRC